MAILMTRYDLRRPDFAKASHSELYRTAIDQIIWADKHNFLATVLSEHHGSPDGYMPSSRVMAAAVAPQTSNIQIHLSALIAPLHEPVRLAEELATLSLLSNGRVMPVLSGGYREEEFAAIGKSLDDRKDYMEMIVPFLRKAFTGEPFEHEGREVQVTPVPEVVPMLIMGGSSKAAARRAARHADYYIPTTPEHWQVYRDELAKLGKPDMGGFPAQPATVFFTANDPDEFWESLGPHARHEQHSYAEWAEKSGTISPYSFYDNINDLRDSGKYTVLKPADMIETYNNMGRGDPLILSPLVGGLDPDVSWANLKLFETDVFPNIKETDVGVFK